MTQQTTALRPALFLDRDGVINEEVHYLHRWEDCRFVEGIVPLLRIAHELGFATIVVTNQAGIARGLYTEADFHLLTKQMGAALRAEGVSLDAVYYSPFHPEGTVEQFRRETDCRKPAPGMLLRAAAEHGLDVSRSVLVGDRCTDIAAGHSAGVPHLFLFGTTEAGPCTNVIPYFAVDTFQPVLDRLRSIASAKPISLT